MKINKIIRAIMNDETDINEFAQFLELGLLLPVSSLIVMFQQEYWPDYLNIVWAFLPTGMILIFRYLLRRGITWKFVVKSVFVIMMALLLLPLGLYIYSKLGFPIAENGWIE
jgi:hypothetical protein